MESILNQIVSRGFVIISGKIGSGKDTIGKIIADELIKRGHSIRFASAAGEVNKIYQQITGIDYSRLPRVKKELLREQFRDFANATKQILGKDVWAKKVVEYDKGNDILIVTDFRFIEDEWTTYKNHEPYCIRINRPIQLRFPDQYESYQNYLVKAEKFPNTEIVNFDRYIQGIDPLLYDKVFHYSETELDSFEHFHLKVDNNFKTLEELVNHLNNLNHG